MITWIYMTAPPRGKVHLVPPFRERALCGAAVRPDWESGDETMSGIRATCPTCLDRRQETNESAG